MSKPWAHSLKYLTNSPLSQPITITSPLELNPVEFEVTQNGRETQIKMGKS